jgi:Ni/Co efflux regulator RcnB
VTRLKEGVIMKRYRRFLLALLIGSSVLLAPDVTGAFARPAPQPQDHGRDKEDHGHGKKDQGRKKENRGQRKKWERDRQGRYRFDDHDRNAVAEYYRSHRYRYEHERIPPGLQFGAGYVVEPRYRRYFHPVPVVLVRELPPPPEGYRYYLFNGNVVLLDGGYRVHDYIHLELNFGR